LENYSKIMEGKEDKLVKSIIKAIAHSSKEGDNIGSSEEDTTILEGDSSKEGTSKKNGNVAHKSFFLLANFTLLIDFTLWVDFTV
jgi:hypothetical protein